MALDPTIYNEGMKREREGNGETMAGSDTIVTKDQQVKTRFGLIEARLEALEKAAANNAEYYRGLFDGQRERIEKLENDAKAKASLDADMIKQFKKDVIEGMQIQNEKRERLEGCLLGLPEQLVALEKLCRYMLTELLYSGSCGFALMRDGAISADTMAAHILSLVDPLGLSPDVIYQLKKLANIEDGDPLKPGEPIAGVPS